MKLNMHTPNLVDENIRKIAELFPNAVTVRKNERGQVERAVDFDVLRQELSQVVVEGPQERYQFTWPDKRQSMLLANAPISDTLRPSREESVNFDTTQNLYIEGDNLNVLKLLRETYLGKVKMIYIDPPYNTGNDFVYEDDFREDTDAYLGRSGQYDEEGMRLVQNTESNGRFHTDWLNMMYPRLRLAKDFLTEEGVIFISIDDNEVANLWKICNEIFGESNFVAQFPWRKRTAKSDVPFGVSQDYEWILCFAGNPEFKASIEGGTRKYYETEDLPGRPWRVHDLTTQRSSTERPNSSYTMINPKNGEEFPVNPKRTWAVTKETFDYYYKNKRIVFPGDYDFLSISRPAFRYFKDDDMDKAGEMFGYIAVSTKLPDEIGMTQDGTKDLDALFGAKLFGFPKPVSLIKYLIKITSQFMPDAIIMDFFSGSATTAHAVMQLNAEDGGNRKFIMVQLPEATDEKSEAYKAGYKNICEIGKERIRRAGAKIKEELDKENQQVKLGEAPRPLPDTGFRVLKLDSSNMKDVYYTPAQTTQMKIEDLADNIKQDRTPEDLLFQVMLELGVLPSSGITETRLGGKRVFSVAEGFLLACFDSDINETAITEIAKLKPHYAVFRDSGYANDSVATNFEQIFKAYSPHTVRRVL